MKSDIESGSSSCHSPTAIPGLEGSEKLPEPIEEIVPLSPVSEDSIPDGGFNAWLQVAGCFALTFNSWGIVNSYGVFQTYYATDLLRTSSPDSIAWIGSIQSFLLLGGGIIAGPLFDAGYFSVVISTGAFLIGFGAMMTSLATQYWHFVLAQGFCIGMGAGCLIAPGLALLPQYFVRRALVTGIAVCGASLGGVTYALTFQGLVGRIGFAWTVRVIGFIALTTCSFAVAVMRQRSTPRKVRSLIDPKAFREPPYLYFVAGMCFSNLAFFVPIFYLQTYALGHGLSDENVALHLVAILNAASVFGRLWPSWATIRIGTVNTMVVVTAMAAIVAFCWTAVDTAAGNIVFAVFYGFTTGGIVSLPAVVLASITDDLSFLGARLGTANFFQALMSLSGPPIAGRLLTSTGTYLSIQLFAGAAISLTSVLMYACRSARTGPGLLVKG